MEFFAALGVVTISVTIFILALIGLATIIHFMLD